MIDARGLGRRLTAVVLLMGIGWLAQRAMHGQWRDFRAAAGTLRPRTVLVLASGAAVLLLYAVQIHAWRTLVSAWGRRLPFLVAARVWSIAGLARYAPFSVVATTGTLGVLGRAAGVPAVAAAGSAILGTLINLATGVIIVTLTSAGLLRVLVPALPSWSVGVMAVASVFGLIAVPFAIRQGAALSGRLLRRDFEMLPIPARVLWTAVTSNVVAWLLYGAAFRLLALSLIPSASGDWVAYTAVFTAGYLAGFLVIPLPAGIGVRELALNAGLTALHLVRPGEAAVVVVASRLLLTLLEVLPGGAFLARDALSRSPTSTDAPS